MTMLPMVNEATAMAEELNKGVTFEITLVSPQARGLKTGKTEVEIYDSLLTVDKLVVTVHIEHVPFNSM